MSCEQQPFSMFTCVTFLCTSAMSGAEPKHEVLHTFNSHVSHGRDFTACFMKPLHGFSQWFLTVFYNRAKWVSRIKQIYTHILSEQQWTCQREKTCMYKRQNSK